MPWSSVWTRRVTCRRWNGPSPCCRWELGDVEGVTHNCVRHGATTLFAALDVATGTVLTQCKPRHRRQELRQFLRHIDANVPANLDVHLMVDNYATHQYANVKRWLAARPAWLVTSYVGWHRLILW